MAKMLGRPWAHDLHSPPATEQSRPLPANSSDEEEPEPATYKGKSAGGSVAPPPKSTGAAAKKKTTLAVDMQASLNAMSPNYNRTMAIAGGRDVFRLFTIGDDLDNIEARENMKSNQKQRLDASCTDVHWHPNEQHKNFIVTGSVSGTLALWDIDYMTKRGSKIPFKITQNHSRAVNTVRFVKDEPFIVLSGSQDRTVLKWDYRDQDKTNGIIFKTPDSVRQIAVDPLNPNVFAVAVENGAILTWDDRNNKQHLTRIHGHEGPCYAIAWHPTQPNNIASGGRDAVIRIWDITKDTTREQLLHTIPTIAPVVAVEWLGSNPNHIAGAALVHDTSVRVWDVTRPWLPVYTYEEHTDVVTGIFWANSHLYSCSKNGWVYRHSVEDAYEPILDAVARSHGVCLSPRGGIARFDMAIPPAPEAPVQTKTASRFSRGKDAQPEPAPQAVSLTSITTSTLMVIPDCDPSLSFVTLPDGSRTAVFEYLARNYWLQGMPAQDLCMHNAAVAEAAGHLLAAQTWRVLLEAFFPFHSMEDAAKLLEQETAAAAATTAALHPPADARAAAADTTADASLLANAQLDQGPLPSATNSMAGLFSEETGIDDNFSEPALRGFGDVALRQDPFEQQLPLSEDSAEDAYSSEEEREQARQFLSTYNEAHLPLTTVKVVPERIIIKDEMVAPWAVDGLLEMTLRHFAEMGDMQMCCTLLLVLGPGRTVNIDDATQIDWFLNYAELLDQWQLWTVRGMILRLCSHNDVRRLSQESTTIHVSCATCNKPLTAGGCCSRCRRPTKCVLCHMPVRDLFVWCQGCGHGGHLEHMRDWFQRTSACPTGCGHNCGL